MIKLILIILLLPGCAIVTEHGKRPKLRIDNPYADDTAIKFGNKGFIIEMKWEI